MMSSMSPYLRNIILTRPMCLRPEEVEIDEKLSYEERPVKLLDRKVKELKLKQIPLVKLFMEKYGGNDLGSRRGDSKEVPIIVPKSRYEFRERNSFKGGRM